MEPQLHPAAIQVRFQERFDPDPDFDSDSDFDVSPLLSGPAAFEFGRALLVLGANTCTALVMPVARLCLPP